MDTRTVAKGSVLGAFAYMAIYAIVAGVWRRAILSDTYESNGFFDFNDPTAASSWAVSPLTCSPGFSYRWCTDTSER